MSIKIRVLLFLATVFAAIGQASAQTTSYTQGGLTVLVTVSNPCDGSTTNGFLRFQLVSASGGSATILLLLGDNGFLDGTDQVLTLPASDTYTYTSLSAGSYDFVISDGSNNINTLPAGVPLPATLTALSAITLTDDVSTDLTNSSCSSPDGRIAFALTNGSRALPGGGSFGYTITRTPALAGFPLTGTYDGVATLDIRTLYNIANPSTPISGLSAAQYAITIDDQNSVCGATKSWTVSDPSPTSFAVSTSTTPVCLGAGGTVNLAGSESGVNYEIYRGGVATGITLPGTGSGLNFAIPPGQLSPVGSYNFTVRAVNGSCTPAFMSGTATIVVNALPTPAVAGPNQTICSSGTATLAANTPTVGTGAWTVTSGPSALSSQFDNVTSPAAVFTPAGGAGAYVLTWTISNAPCTPSTSNVTITVNAPPSPSVAGPNQSICSSGTATLAANAPGVGVGAWTVTSGPSTLASQFSNVSSPTAGFTPAGGAGAYVLTWTISNAPCTPSASNVTINVTAAPTTSVAGSNQTICTTGTAPLAANTPTVGTGAWTVTSGPSTLASQFSSVTIPTAVFTPAGGPGAYVLTWTISNAPCTPSTSNVTITVNAPPSASNAGPNQTGASTCGLTSTTLAGNIPAVGTGLWSIVSGTGGSITAPGSPNSAFSGVAGSTYVLRWTISNTPCLATQSDVTITFNQSPTNSVAGPNQSICTTGTAPLAANTPTVGTGAWTVTSGPSTLSSQFDNVASPTAVFTPAGGAGAYVLTWTISNAPCTPSTSNVTITVNAPPSASNAGPNQTGASTCGLTSTTLAGNIPAVGTGLWSIVSGTGGSITAPGSPNSAFSGVAGSTYVLRWTISNAPCLATQSDVTITFNQSPTNSVAGPNQSICTTGTALLAANTPSVGTGAWTVTSGPSTLSSQFDNVASPTAVFTPAGGAGAYVLTWTISNAPCTPSASNVTISVTAAPTPSIAGSNQSICTTSTAALTANTPSVGTGAWTVTSGPSTLSSQFSNVASPTAVFTPAGGAGAYVLTWTITNAPCTPSVSNVTVNVTNPPTTAAAGSDQIGASTCGLTTVTLAGNTPTSGTGAWSVVAGTGGSFANPASPTSTFTGVAGTTYTLRWTINNLPCPASQDDVVVTFNQNPTASNAGTPQNICVGGNVVLAANTPTIGIGAWSIASGPSTNLAQLTTTTSPSATFTPAGGAGSYILTWTISNSPCTTSASSVTVTVSALPVTSVITGSSAVCANSNGSAYSVVGTPGSTYAWTIVGGSQASGTNTNSITVNWGAAGAGSVQVIETNSATCVGLPVNLAVTKSAGPTFTTSRIDVTSCVTPNGSITITSASGGSGAPFTYSRDGGTTFPGSGTIPFTFSGLVAGTYPVVVRDATGCSSAATNVTVANTASTLAFTTTNVSVLCNGASTGSISVSATGGSGTYTYSINGGVFGTPSVFSSLAAASYTIAVQDGNGCQVQSTVVITQPSAVSFSASKTDVACNGGATGSITITASGGTGTYQYSRDNGGTFQVGNSFLSLAAGTYQVVVRDANNCTTAATPVIITQPTAVSFTTSKTDATTCTPGNDGSITITALGGSGGYQYSRDNGATFQGSNVFNGLTAGAYQVVVRDGSGCLAPAASVSIDLPGGLSFSSTKTDVTCNGSSNGSIMLTASGGSGGNQFSRDNGTTFQPTGNFTGLVAGSYMMVVRDNSSCQFSATVVINQPASVSFTSTSTNITCNGASNGSITISAAGGNSSYTYSNDNGTTFVAGNVFSGLAPAAYSVVVRDGNNCLSPASTVTISQPAAFSFTSSKTDASTCTPGTEGSITISATGGTSPYQYSRDNGVTFQPGSSFSGLSAATYQVVVRDANNCTSNSSIVIAGPVAPNAAFSGLAGPYCTSGGNVTLTPTTSGGTFSGPGMTGSVFSPSTAGAGSHAIQYSITVSGCTSTTTQNVTVVASTVDSNFSGLNPTYCPSSPAVTLTPVTGGGTFSGPGVSGSSFAPATAGSGTHTIQYSITSGGCTSVTTRSVTVLLAGDPICTGGGGTGTCATVVIVPKPSPATCTNSDGRIVFSIKPFVPAVNNTGVKISIVGVSPTNQTISRTNFNDSTMRDLPIGTYDWTIEYGDVSCTKTGQVTIDRSGTVGVPVLSNPISPNCFGSADGRVTISVPGETGNILEWGVDSDPVSNTNAIVYKTFISGDEVVGVPAGEITISVRRNSTDPCASGATITLTGPSAITATATATNATCNNNDGSILLGAVSGGTAPYTYRLDGVPVALPANSTFSGLAGGSHTITITDSKSCVRDIIVPITFPGFVDFNAAAVNPDCSSNGGNGGIVVAINSSGTFQVGVTTDPVNPPTSFVNVVSSGTTTQTFSNLAKGAYVVYVRSISALCPAKSSITISAGPDRVDFNVNASDILCFEDKGTVVISAVRGAALVNFNYEIIKQGAVAKSGAITALQAVGNVPITGLDKGDYLIRLTQDQSVATGCAQPISSVFKPFVINGPDQALDTLYVNRTISFPDLPTGSMVIGIKESKEEPYEVRLELIAPLFTGQAFVQDWTIADRNRQSLKVEYLASKLFAGDYQLSIRDALGCIKNYPVTLKVDTNITIPNIFTPNGDGVNDNFFIRNLPAESSITISNRWGKEVFASKNYLNDWNGGEIADGVYFYRLLAGGQVFTGWVELVRGR